jgi:hypothetical protein
MVRRPFFLTEAPASVEFGCPATGRSALSGRDIHLRLVHHGDEAGRIGVSIVKRTQPIQEAFRGWSLSRHVRRTSCASNQPIEIETL